MEFPKLGVLVNAAIARLGDSSLIPREVCFGHLTESLNQSAVLSILLSMIQIIIE